MLRITEIKGEDIYFNNGKVLWILYFQGLSALGRAPKLPTSDLIKVGNPTDNKIATNGKIK